MMNEYNNMVSTKSSKFIYVKPNFLPPSHTNVVPKPNPGTTKILVNPNFKPNVHINPHFNKQFSVPTKTTIHVNPMILKPKTESLQRNTSCAVNLKVSAVKCDLRPGFSFNSNVLNVPSVSNRKTIISTRTKIVRAPATPKKPSVNVSNTPSKLKTAIYSKYKIVKSTQQSENKRTSKICIVRNKFKIINNHNVSKISNSPKVKILQNISLSKHKRPLSKCNYLKINGILYKTSPNAIRRSNSFESALKTKMNVKIKTSMNKIVSINGVKYEMNGSRKKLQILMPKEGQLVKGNIRRLSLKKKSIKSSSLRIQISPSKLKKCNVPCLFYRKYGRCRGKDRGTCNKRHNPDQIIICPRFLQGACINETCLLSHNVSPEKMPTCKFFLEGMCFKEGCPYLHVKISPKAEICRDFLQGFCKKAKECDKRHQVLCPEFEKTGKCLKRRCPYPHGNEIKKGMTKSLKLSINRNTRKRDLESIKMKRKIRVNDKDKNCKDEPKKARYYEDVKGTADFQSESAVTEREKLGALPAFIPLHDSGMPKSG